MSHAGELETGKAGGCSRAGLLGRSSLLVISFFLVLAFLGCGDGQGYLGNGPNGPKPDVCADSLILCGESCVDIASSRYHCGGCFNECGSEDFCVDHACSSVCPDEFEQCSGDCVDLATSVDHCGACGSSCPSGALCVGGECQLSCQSPRLLCGEECVDPQSDAAHCGRCDRTCPAMEVCSLGVCQPYCAHGLTACSGSCVDLMTDPSNCGRCGSRCSTIENCVEGSCVSLCPDGLAQCNGVCVNLQTDENNCGRCGTRCTANHTCFYGACVSNCNQGETDCGGQCVNLQTDNNNCGACGVRCPTGQRCSSGRCVLDCPTGQTDCNGQCVSLQTSTSHCGSCNTRCASGVSCSSGQCQVSCGQLSLVSNPQMNRSVNGIHSLTVGGVNLIEANGGYYIIGTCTGADDELHNVISLGSNGSTLRAPGNCPGAPFSITYSGTNPLRVTIRVGPLPVTYKGLSVPFDPHRDYFTDFSFSGSGYVVGCANSWTSRSGSGGAFTSIPQPCHISGHGSVGIARVTSVPNGMWGEIRGPHATIRRVVVSSNLRELFFVRHPYTHNVEYSWGTEPLSSSNLPAGSVWELVEDIYIYQPASGGGGGSSSKLVSWNLPPGPAGATVPARVTMCNDGGTTWSEPSNNVGGIRLGSLSSNQIRWVPGASGGYSNGVTDQRIYVPASISPGGIVNFDFSLRLPSHAGSHAFGARMVHDGVAWFGPELNTTVQVTQ